MLLLGLRNLVLVLVFWCWLDVLLLLDRRCLLVDLLLLHWWTTLIRWLRLLWVLVGWVFGLDDWSLGCSWWYNRPSCSSSLTGSCHAVTASFAVSMEPKAMEYETDDVEYAGKVSTVGCRLERSELTT